MLKRFRNIRSRYVTAKVDKIVVVNARSMYDNGAPPSVSVFTA